MSEQVPGTEDEMEIVVGQGLVLKLAIAGTLAICVAAVGYNRLGSLAAAEQAVEEVSKVTFVPAAIRGNGRYPDGTYTTIGVYAPHGMPTDLKVELTLENDVITASEVTLLDDNPTSIRVTNKFQGGYKELVIGKPIQELSLDAVSGSSLTPRGYNAALRQIEEYATTL